MAAQSHPADLAQLRATLAALWDDPARLAGETPPVAVRQRCEADSPR